MEPPADKPANWQGWRTECDTCNLAGIDPPTDWPVPGTTKEEFEAYLSEHGWAFDTDEDGERWSICPDHRGGRGRVTGPGKVPGL